MVRAYSLVPNIPCIPSAVRMWQERNANANECLEGFCLLLTMVCPQWESRVAHDPHCCLVLADYSTSEMLVNMGNLPLDEFYPAVSMSGPDQHLSRPVPLSPPHHGRQAITPSSFKSLGLKCVQFLPQGHAHIPECHSGLWAREPSEVSA